jgi:hypothetical protein
MRHSLCLLTLSMIAAVSTAHAQGSSVDATLHNITFALAFPDPSKPQDPFIGEVDGTGSTMVSGDLQGGQPAGPTSDSQAGLLRAVEVGRATALGSYAFSVIPGGGGYDTWLTALGGTTSMTSFYSASDMQISPWAVATYSLDVDIASQLAQVCNGACDHIEVTGGLQWQLADGSGPLTRDAFDYVLDAGGGPRDGSILADAFSKHLAVSFDNSASGDIPTIRLAYDFQATAFSGAVAPVPEPSAPMLLTLGLGAFALWRRRETARRAG